MRIIMTKSIYSILVLVLLTTIVRAQGPAPAGPQERPIALIGGTAHLGNGTVIQNAVIGFDKGKLTLVADASTTPNLSGYQVIRIEGKHVYPGFILPNSQLGLQEVASVRAMDDYSEEGVLNPNVRAVISYNTDSEYIPAMRFNGVLLVETTPVGGLISGSSSVMEHEGWNWEDALHTADIGIHMHWPDRVRREFDNATFTVNDVPNKDYDKQVQLLTSLFSDAAAYSGQTTKVTNLKLEAMLGLFDGSKTLLIHAGQPKEIIESVRFAQHHGVKRITLLSAQSAWYVSDFLRENKVPVILPETQELPERTDDDVDMMYKLPYLLTQAGVSVSLSGTGMLGRSRNLGFYAGSAAAYGLSKEEALKTITLNTAVALGVDKRVGSIEVGKDATLFVSEGDALDYRTNVLLYAFISGKQVTLPGNQQELYERYMKKYGLK
jgi:imidazolonepropionase-like amidohydrolase